jgi:K+-sensing histidine kinase KdpD
MSNANAPGPASTPVMNVTWNDVVRFFRQVSHDIRNHLNAVELQSAFLAELTTDPELKEEISRLRKMVSDAGGSLQKLSVRLNPPSPNLTTYQAMDLVEDLRAKLRTEFPQKAASVAWEVQADDSILEVDPQLVQDAVLEVFRNAFEHQTEGASLRFIARTENGNLVLTLYEPKTQWDLPTGNWGREPLRGFQRGHYGLGLNRARTIIEAQRGTLSARYDPPNLVSTIVLPVSAAKS